MRYDIVSISRGATWIRLQGIHELHSLIQTANRLD